MRDGRRVPIKSLMCKLNVEEYNLPSVVHEGAIEPKQIVLPLKQGAGVPNQAIVKAGDKVRAGQPLGHTPVEHPDLVALSPRGSEVYVTTRKVVDGYQARNEVSVLKLSGAKDGRVLAALGGPLDDLVVHVREVHDERSAGCHIFSEQPKFVIKQQEPSCDDYGCQHDG